jgi:hypothetical protein
MAPSVSWFWTFESASGEPVGQSEMFDSRSDAESWIGEAFPDLLERGIVRVRLLEGVQEIYEMSLEEA